MKQILRLLSTAFREYARERNWSPEDYRVFINPNLDWGSTHLIFAARKFSAADGNPWSTIMHFLDLFFADQPDIYNSLNLFVSTFDQLERGGFHEVSGEYEAIEDLIADRSTI